MLPNLARATMRKNILAAITASLLLLPGCKCGDDRPRMQKSEVVQGDSFLLNSDDFDLETVIGLVKGNGVSNIEELEAQVNSPDSGINNVDLDADGMIDYISVRENRDGGNFTLEFMAVPSSTKKEADANLVASMNIKQSGESTEVSGSYPSYVHGHDTHHYHYSHRGHGLSMGEAMFLAYMFSPSRVMYMSPRPYMAVGYAPRSYMSASQRTTTRSSYTKTSTKVSPVAKSAKPAGYKPAPSASKTQSRFNKGTVKPNPADKSLSSRNKAAKSYSKHSGTKQKATGFGSSKSKSSSSSSSKKKSSGWGGSSSRSRSRSSSRGGGFRGGRSCLPQSERKVIKL